MKKLRTYSPYYDYKLVPSPYQNYSKVSKSRDKQVYTAQEKKTPLISIQHKEKCKSAENLSNKLRKDIKSAGDFNDASKEISENLFDHKHLNSKECQTIWQAQTSAHELKRVSTHDECHHLVGRR